uniref:Uncharacterized protein n=1 Tax=Kalanchoe fedtschenkoi TaxID=63787 RepID=A0A7N0U4P8_KALFE
MFNGTHNHNGYLHSYKWSTLSCINGHSTKDLTETQSPNIKIVSCIIESVHHIHFLKLRIKKFKEMK